MKKADNGNRTRLSGLGSQRSTDEPYLHSASIPLFRIYSSRIFKFFMLFTKFVCTVCHSCSLQYDMNCLQKKNSFFSFHQQHD